MQRLRTVGEHLTTAISGVAPAPTVMVSGGVEFSTLEEAGAPHPNGGLRITMLPGLPGLVSAGNPPLRVLLCGSMFEPIACACQWAEALKNLCDVKKLPYTRLIHPFGDRDAQAFLYELTAQRSLPTMLYNDDPPRSSRSGWRRSWARRTPRSSSRPSRRIGF